MILNARQSPEGSSIKDDYHRGKFSGNKRNSENFDSQTSKLQPVNLSETSRDTAGIH